MTDVFISYAHEDMRFVRLLHDALRKKDEREIWVDWQGIPPSAEWLREIYAAIEAATCFIFVISPDSLASRVCGLELAHAELHNKRIIAVVRRDLNTLDDNPLSVPEAVGKINWIFCRDSDSFEKALRQVIESLDTDLEHVRSHARLTVRAVEWQASGSENGFLLHGEDLENARRWLDNCGAKEPGASLLQQTYIEASRRRAADNLAARTLVEFPDNPELALLLVEAAVTELAATPTCKFALRMALANYPLRVSLPTDHDEILGAAWSPDGSRLVTIGQDGKAHTWNVWTGVELSVFTKHGAKVTTIAWSSDSAWIVTGSEDGSARIWNPLTEIELAVLSHDTITEAVVSVAWSEDGSRVLTAPKKGRTAIWKIAEPNAEPLWLGHSLWLVAARWNLTTNRVLLLTGSEGVVSFDAVSGTPLFGLRLARPGVRDGVWSRDGSLIATCSGSRAHVWSGQNGALLSELAGHGSDVTSLAFDPTGARLATASTDRTVRIWDPRTGDEMRRLSRHENSVLSVSWSPDGKRLLTVAADRTARIWDAARERQLVEFREGSSSQHVGAWSPNGTHVATFGSNNSCRIYAAYPGDWSFGLVAPTSEGFTKGDDDKLLLVRWMGTSQILTIWRGGSVKLHDSETGSLKCQSMVGEHLTGALVSPDGSQLLTVGESRMLRTLTLAASTKLVSLGAPDNTVPAFHWSPDSSRVLVISTDGRISVADASSGALITEIKPRRRPQPGEKPAASWSPDGTRFLSFFEFTQTEAVRVWNATTADQLTYISAADLSQLWYAEWSPGGRWIVIVAGTVRLIDPDSSEVKRVLSPGEDFFSSAVSFSPDCAHALIGLASGVVEIWELEGSAGPRHFRGHEDRVHFGVWSADGTQVLTVSNDATARVWNATNGELITTLRGHDGPLWNARWSADEQLILTRSSDHSARIWDAKSGEPIVRIGGIDDPVEQAEWHPLGRRVLVQTATGAWIWDIDVGLERLLSKTRSRVSRQLTPEERRSYGMPVAR